MTLINTSIQPAVTRLPDGEIRNGGISHWLQSLGMPARRTPLPGDLDVDVAIVGAGMTGLWTAYYLKKADPGLRIALVERSFVGFGASGRNAGWLSAEPAGLWRHYVESGGLDGALALQRAMFDTVDEALHVINHEGIEADAVKDGLMYVAVNKAQTERLRARFQGLHQQGWGSDDLEWLDGTAIDSHIHIDGAVAGYATPHCARIDPAKLTLGLAKVVEDLGVAIYEDTTATDIQPHRVLTDRGVVRADVVVRALEGYTASLKGHKRTLLPMNSSIVVTEPLTPELWEELGWQSSRLIGDAALSYTYMQRTADGRLAIGGRGVPYNYAGRFDPNGQTAVKAVLQLREHMKRLFPATRDVRLEHTWTGVLGVPRDWSGAVTYDQHSGVVTAGGYVGHGVSGTNLAGRTVRDLVLRQDTELTALPWVNHHTRAWEPEPVRWVGATGLYALYRFGDRLERHGSRPSRIGKFADLLSGRH